jgi:2-dehydropantoate 2-reductase
MEMVLAARKGRMMKIATMATGGIGGYLAVKLTQSGHQVATIARGPHLEAIIENGLTLESPFGNARVRPWIATDDPSQVGPVDAVIFAVKGDALEQAAKAVAPMLGPYTVVIPFLNGVEASDRLIEFLPEPSIANGIAQVSTTIVAPGVIRQTGEFNRFIFAERDSRPSARIDTFRNAISASGASAPHTDDIKRDLWTKFVFFSALSGITAAGRCTIGDVIANEPLARLFRAVLSETASIGRASGVALPDAVEKDAWTLVQSLPTNIRASTAIDLENGLPLEIEWISGAVGRISKTLKIEAPINAALYALLLPHRNGR